MAFRVGLTVCPAVSPSLSVLLETKRPEAELQHANNDMYRKFLKSTGKRTSRKSRRKRARNSNYETPIRCPTPISISTQSHFPQN